MDLSTIPQEVDVDYTNNRNVSATFPSPFKGYHMDNFFYINNNVDNNSIKEEFGIRKFRENLEKKQRESIEIESLLEQCRCPCVDLDGGFRSSEAIQGPVRHSAAAPHSHPFPVPPCSK